MHSLITSDTPYHQKNSKSIMMWFLEKLPLAKTVILFIFWIQITSALMVFFLSQESLFQTRKGIEYTIEEIDSSPSELRTRKFTRTTIPTLKKDKTQRPSVTLPSKISDQLDFSVVKIRGFGKGVLLSGEIADGDAQKFVEFIKNVKGLPIEFVALHSPGGSVMEAMIIGEEIRERALKTMLPGHSYCYSACPYIMAGGIERIFSSYSLLGVHQHFFPDNMLIPVYFAVQSVQEGQAKTFRHLKQMGINTEIMEHILSTPPEEIYVLSTEELEKYNFATELIGPA